MSNEPKSWLERISDALMREPQDQQELVRILRDAHDRELLDKDALLMIEGILRFNQLAVSEVMIPRAKMIALEENAKLKTILQIIVDSGHSRFPVLSENHDEIRGILFAKDLVNHTKHRPFSSFNIKSIIRPVVFIPESKKLNVLLKEFQLKRYHMAIVIDEYGSISGLITIEDVLEQIVGNIEDEYDPVDAEPNIKKDEDNAHIIKANTPIDEFNDYFGVQCALESADSVGGWVLQALGHLPQRGENINIAPFCFTVLHADNRKINLLKMHISNKNENNDNDTNQESTSSDTATD